MSKWQSERSIHDMLKDTPPLRESSDSITSGAEAKFPTSHSMPFPSAYSPPDSSTSLSQPSTPTAPPPLNRLNSIKEWSVTTYRCTKQMVYERLGKTPRTVDTELEAQIEMVRETQRKYNNILRLSTLLTSQLLGASHTLASLGEAFAELAQKSPELQQQFLYNADTQRSLTRNGQTLLSALQFFNNSLNTLTNKTIEDTLLTVRQYEAARIEYDAVRNTVTSDGRTVPSENERKHYERLKEDVAVKLNLLHENRIKVMSKQLVLFHNAVAAYFSGNKQALDTAVRHFNVPTTSTT